MGKTTAGMEATHKGRASRTGQLEGDEHWGGRRYSRTPTPWTYYVHVGDLGTEARDGC